MYQIHVVFRFNPRSRCNNSSRCCYRAREHVDPAWSRRIRHGGDSHPEMSSSPGSVGLARATDLYAKFSANYCWYDFVPIKCDWICAICLICWLVRFRTNYGGYSHFPTSWYDFVPIITGVFYLLVRCRASHRWIWAAGPWLLCFSRSICFGQSINFCDPITRWSSSHFRFAVH